MKKNKEKKTFSRREKILAWIMIGIMTFSVVAAALSLIITHHVH